MADAPASKKDLGEVGKLVAIVFLVVIALVFIALNNDRVQVDFLLFDTEMRIWVTLLGTTLIGVVIGYLLANLRRRK
jgi:uncharacterized integral membrane protein